MKTECCTQIRRSEHTSTSTSTKRKKQWDFYNKWLSASLNKNLLILEIGEDFNHPNIFRWPFEKVVFINQKAKMYRISDLFYHLPIDIGDRAKSVKINGMSFVCDLMDYIV